MSVFDIIAWCLSLQVHSRCIREYTLRQLISNEAIMKIHFIRITVKPWKTVNPDNPLK
jgi:hypothetical protein